MVSQRTAICMLPPEVWTCNALAAEVNGIGVWRSHSRCRHIVPNPRQSAGALVNVTIELQSSHCLGMLRSVRILVCPLPKIKRIRAVPGCPGLVSHTHRVFPVLISGKSRRRYPQDHCHCNEPFHRGSNASCRDYGRTGALSLARHAVRARIYSQFLLTNLLNQLPQVSTTPKKEA